MTRPIVQLPMGSSGLGAHQLAPFVSCPKKYQYARVRDIHPRMRVLPDPLAIGLLMHAARAQVLTDSWADDSPWEKCMRTYFDAWNKSEFRIMVESQLLCAVKCATAWVDHWRRFPRAQALAVELQVGPRPLLPGGPPVTWRTARYDSIERWRGKTWIGECKTTSSPPSKVVDHYALDIQPLLCVALWSDVETAKYGPLAGVLYDIVVKPSGAKAARAVERHPVPIDNLHHALTWFRKSFASWAENAHAIRWNDDVPRQIGACIGPYGPCDYRELCLKGPAAARHFMHKDGRPIEVQSSDPSRVDPWR